MYTPHQQQEESGVDKKWHASWIIAALVGLAPTAIVAWTGLEMTPAIIMIVLGCILATALLWLMTSAKVHTAFKIGATGILFACTGFTLQWVYRFDRPIISPEIGGLFSQNYNGTQFALDIETLIQNAGRQDGYAERWKLTLTIDGAEIEGKQIFGQPLPPKETLHKFCIHSLID